MDGIFYSKQIEIITADEVPVFLNLYKQLDPSLNSICIKYLISMIKNPNNIFVGSYKLYKHGGEFKMGLIGIATLHLEKKIIHNGKYLGHIEDVVVDSAYRKKGAAKGMIRELIKQATANNCYKVILSCDPALSNLYKNVFNEYNLKQKEEVSLSLYLNV